MHAAAEPDDLQPTRPLGGLRPLADMVDYLAGRVGAAAGDDADSLEFVSAGQKRHTVRTADFAEIPDTDRPRRIAFVDGGNATLADAPSFIIGMNRVYYSVFRGDRRQRPARQPRIEFFSCMTAGAQRASQHAGAVEKGAYSARLFARNAADRGRLPPDDHLVIQPDDAKGRGASRDSLLSIPRRMAEWAVAGSVIDSELRAGDMLVMDGTLQSRSLRETEFVAPICRRAVEKGVVLCGLAKTSTLVDADNLPLIGRATELAGAAGLGGRRWFVGVCDQATANDKGYTYVAKFHEKSRYVFRFGVLSEQHRGMSGGEVESILASIAANSRDISMPGYPYGAIDADRFAKVRVREASMHRNMLDAELAGRPDGEGIASQIRSMSMHQALNRVTG